MNLAIDSGPPNRHGHPRQGTTEHSQDNRQQKIQSGLSSFFCPARARISKYRRSPPPQRLLNSKDLFHASLHRSDANTYWPNAHEGCLRALTLIFGESLDKVIGDIFRFAGRHR